MAIQSDSFISSSDFATLKNDIQPVMASVFVPGNVTIPANGYVEWHTDVSAAFSNGSYIRSRNSSTKNGGLWITGLNISYIRTSSAGPYNYTLLTTVYILSSGIIRCKAAVLNPYSLSMPTELGDETINFVINTLVPPFG